MGLSYDFTYINSNGEFIDFGGLSRFWVDSDSFRSYEYSYRELNGRISGFYMGLKTYSFNLGIESDGVNDAVDLTEQLRKLSSYDIKANKPGIIKIGDYQTEGYIVGLDYSSEGSDDFYGYETGLSISIAIENPIWYTEELVRFKPQIISSSSAEGLNYPFNYPFNYGARRNVYRQFYNDEVLSCPFRLLVYGRAVDPYVRIGSNLYQVNATIAQGGYLVIDSRKREIYEIQRLGNRVEHIRNRLRGTKGSGQYIFEEITSGYNNVIWDNTFGFDLYLIHESPYPPFFKDD